MQGRAAERLSNSASKRIEDVVITEMPDRYVTNGLQNWSLINRDVATLQKRLNGKLPSRENVQKLLKDVVALQHLKPEEEKFINVLAAQSPLLHLRSFQVRLTTG
jgi:predicted transcriptional regulator